MEGIGLLADASNVAVALVVVLVFLGIATLVGAMVLRAACSLFNYLAKRLGSTEAVPDPDFGNALGIVFVTQLLNGVFGFLIGLAGASANAQVLAFVVSVPVAYVVLGLMVAGILPTTIKNGIMVALLTLAIGLAIALPVSLLVWLALR